MIKKYFGAILLPIVIAGCGSSSTITVNVGKGEYLDSAVHGVSYECGSEKGTTNEKGEFFYDVGKECNFFLGNYIFKKVKGDDLKNSKTKVYEKDIRVARFLQILDNDGDASNGITITKSVVKKIPIDAYEFNDKSMDKLYTSIKNDVNYTGRMVTTNEAQEHINDTISSDKNVLYAIVKLSSSSVRQGESITFDASDSKGDIKSYIWKIGDTKIGSGMRFTTANLSIGKQIVTLYITDKSGNVDKKLISINVLAPKTVWDSATTMVENATDKLLVRSDAKNLYLKFQTTKTISYSDLTNMKIYINSDDSDVSGLSTGSIGTGLDYLISNEGVFHLKAQEDYVGDKIQDLKAIIGTNSFEVVIDRKNIEYLAQNISAGVSNSDINLYMKSDKKYKIPNYTAPEDKVGPVITLNGANPVSLKKGGTYKDAGATASDVIEGDITMSAPVSDVNTSKAGVYQVKYTAKDSKGNIGTKYRVVEVNGTSTSSTFEIKSIGDYDDTIAINHENGQIWMNDDRGIGVNRGCLVVTTGLSATELKTQVEGFCKNSDFAGFSDWRAPTPTELSKFTVKMKQEKQTVGMERKNCVQTLGIDSSGTVKSVNTHITRLPGLIKTDELTPAGARCVRGAEDDGIGSFHMGVEKGGKIIIDSNQSLIWINEYDPAKKACLAIHVGKPKVLEESKDFCKNLDYAGYSDWRTPTSVELSNFVKKTNEVHILPGYEAPCARLLAKDVNVSTVVYTRFDKKGHGLGVVGNLEANLTSNIGLRCVRKN